MHDRGDYKAGWQLDREWDEKEKQRKAREAAAVAGMLAEAEGGAAAAEEEEDDLPFACFICRRVWAEVRDPVVTRCKHYFCEQCALQHNAKTKTCAACNVRGPLLLARGCVQHRAELTASDASFLPVCAQQATNGVFNTAHEITRRLKDAKDGTAAERAQARREARAAAQKDELARSGAAGWLLG